MPSFFGPAFRQVSFYRNRVAYVGGSTNAGALRVSLVRLEGGGAWAKERGVERGVRRGERPEDHSVRDE